MTKIATTIIFSLITLLHVAQGQNASSGFYMLIVKSRICDNKVYSIRGDKVYCIPREPIISIDQFQSIERLGSGQQFAVDVKLTPEARSTMKKISDALPGSNFLLVVDGTAVVIFDVKGKCISPLSQDDLNWAEKHLVKALGR